ncbi:MAG: DUF58 domain-containing protein [Pseudomonadota bacterium]
MDSRIHISLAQLRALQGAARGLSFLPRQPSASVLNGRHASRLRGRGLNFEEMRDYLPGDDIRSIDWKATARTGSAHVRVFTEERDRPALLVVDQRMSMFFGVTRNMKSVTAAEAAAMVAFRVLDAGDRVGGIVFDDERTVELVPKRGQRTTYALLEAIAEMNAGLHAERPSRATAGSLNRVLKIVTRLAHHDHLVIILSDFDGIDAATHRHLSNIARHNDLILGLVHDPSFSLAGNTARAVLGDGTRQAEFDFADRDLTAAVEGFATRRLERILNWQKEINLSVVPLSAAEETLPQLRRALGASTPRRRVR